MKIRTCPENFPSFFKKIIYRHSFDFTKDKNPCASKEKLKRVSIKV
jgi:hypothetical protein